MAESLCRRELLRRSVVLAGAVVGARVRFPDVTGALAAAGATSWEVPHLPNEGELLGAALGADRTVLYAATRSVEHTQIHSVAVGAAAWASAAVPADATRDDFAFTVAGDRLVLAGARRLKLRERTLGVHLDEEGNQVPAGDPAKPGSHGGIRDNAQIVVEDWTRVPFAVMSADRGATWQDLPLMDPGAPNAWIDQVAAVPGYADVVVLIGSANDEPGMHEGYRTLTRTVPLGGTSAVTLPDLPPLREGCWTAATSGEGELIVAARDIAGARLAALSAGGWEQLAIPGSAQHSSFVAVAVRDGGIDLAGLDSDGRVRVWRSATVRNPRWEERPVPIGVAVGTHVRTLVDLGGEIPVLFGTYEGTPQIAEAKD